METVNVLVHISPSSVYGSAYADSHDHIFALRFSNVFFFAASGVIGSGLSVLLRSRYRFLCEFPAVDTVGEKFTVTGTVGE